MRLKSVYREFKYPEVLFDEVSTKQNKNIILNMNFEIYRMKRMAALAKGRYRVLDIGYADYPNIYLNNPEVIGIDIVESDLPKNYRSHVVGDVMDLPNPFQPCTFNAVVAGEIIEHLERPIDFLRLCYKTLAPGGVIIISTPNPHSPIELFLTLILSKKYYYSKEHIYLFPQRWLIKIIEMVGFCEVKLHSGGIPIPLIGTIPFPRPWCYQTIAVGIKPSN